LGERTCFTSYSSSSGELVSCSPNKAFNRSRHKFAATIYQPGKRKQARSVGERACYDERGSGGLLHSPMDEEERDYFFISSFFMASCAIASSFFMASSCAIAPSFFMASLDEGRCEKQNTRRALHGSISFQGWFGTTLVVPLNTAPIVAPLLSLQNYLVGETHGPSIWRECHELRHYSG
jgi:hypothetical protein